MSRTLRCGECQVIELGQRQASHNAQVRLVGLGTTKGEAWVLLHDGRSFSIPKPQAADSLQPGERQVIDLERIPKELQSYLSAERSSRPERLYGLGTRNGELWFQGTADPEVMSVIAARHAKSTPVHA